MHYLDIRNRAIGCGEVHIEELGNCEICTRYKPSDQNKEMKWTEQQLRRWEIRNGA
jgi:hypothetical protein